MGRFEFVCVCVCAYMCIHMMYLCVDMEVRDNLVESIFFHLCVESEDGVQASRLVWQAPLPTVSNLAIFFFKTRSHGSLGWPQLLISNIFVPSTRLISMCLANFDFVLKKKIRRRENQYSPGMR